VNFRHSWRSALWVRSINVSVTAKTDVKSTFRYLSPNSITPTLRQDTNHESPRRKSRRRLSWFVTLSLTFLVHNGPNSIRDTNGFVANLSRTLLQTSRYVEMVCVHDFHYMCLRLSPRKSFGESRRNGIWALRRIQSDVTEQNWFSIWQTVVLQYSYGYYSMCNSLFHELFCRPNITQHAIK